MLLQGAVADPALAGVLERLIGPGTDTMARRLDALGIPVSVSRSRGVHEWRTWNRELDQAWPFRRAGLGLG